MAFQKVTIIGAGSVGSAIALCVALDGACRHVALYDLDHDRAHAEALDLRHGAPFLPSVEVTGGSDPAILEGSDLVVLAAGAKQKPGQSRLELAGVNADICRANIDEVLTHAPSATVLVVSNPVDVLTQVAAQHHPDGVASVLGSGTVLDTARLRTLMASELDVSPTAVHATVAGEHGDSEFVLWSSATVGGASMRAFLSTADRDESLFDSALAEVRGAAQEIIAGKGWTSTAIGLSAARIIRAIAHDERAVLPVSTLHRIDGVGEVALSLPAVVGRRGVVRHVDVDLDADERDALAASARTILDSVAALEERSA